MGHTKVFAALASVGSGVPLLYLLVIEPVAWLLFRTLTGLCFGGIYVISETWLNDRCTNETRGRILNLYVMIMMVSAGGGALLLNLADPQGYELFVIGSVLISIGIVPLLLSAKPVPSYQAPKRLGLIALYRKAPLGMGAFAIWGLADSALFGAAAIYADKVGLTTAEISIFMVVIYFGALILMWPIGYLSDRLNRPRFLVAVSLSAALIAVLAAVTPPDLELLLYGLTACFAGLTMTHYGLCLAVANDQLEPSEMVAAGATLFVAYGIGTLFGPILVTELMEAWRAEAFFWFMGAIHLVIALYAIAVIGSRAILPPRRQPAAVVSSLSGALATEMALETARQDRKLPGTQPTE